MGIGRECRAGRRGLGYVLTKGGIVVLSFILTALDAALPDRTPFPCTATLPCSKPSLLSLPPPPPPPPVCTASDAEIHLSSSQKPAGSYRPMSVTLLPPRRSASLPISTDGLHDRPCCPSRHGSTVMVVDTTSPPSSPRQVLIRPELTVDDSQPPPYSAKDPDHSPCISPPRSPPHSLSESAPDQDMDVLPLELPKPELPKPAKPPVRVLDNEEEHVHRSLRLQDFELRGTLGTYPFCCPNRWY
jgi:hypothetical protein